ncbi:hypothetical protein [Legionella jamestowniensis]|uniref:Uncharacterized protein n=1 Tax=Legionella jamestowniensis TaxID=455 RepID=A0A0W0UJ93_9GAMM|nr:hypothetical protein [Legionella jamestowniensis]KTD07788.1 hypothetical protein Ljam_1983 [Legionella jamestowniensis]SFL62195.1 hypothetical protein SAMN02746073_1107 [Legionella jamestowniensis DSM 19215]
MPEIITKYPQAMIKVLKGANIQCGIGDKQIILRHCPHDRFCSSPTGELCVYGINDISKMTQIHRLELFKSTEVIFPLIGLLLVGFALGVLFGAKIAHNDKKINSKNKT